MTVKTFDRVPTPSEPITLEMDKISQDSVNQAWQDYQAKPEYKEFNKHDMIDSMLQKANQTDE